MDTGAIYFTIAVLTLVGMYIGQPYIQRRVRRATPEHHADSALMAEYDRMINTLQELDFDNTLGKIPAEDYPKQRAELLVTGTKILKKLDALQASKAGHDAESRIEASVKSRHVDAAAKGNTAAVSDDDLETMIADRRKMRKEKSAGFCPICGKVILVSDQFCPSCGKALN